MAQKAESLEIISTEADIKIVTVYDSCGRIVITRHGNATNNVIFPVGLFGKGLYILRVNGISIKLIL